MIVCGPTLVAGAVPADETSCNMGCGGNTTYVTLYLHLLSTSLNSFPRDSEACGGPSRTSVYTNGPLSVFPVPTPQKDNLPGNFTYAGCLQ